MPDSESHTVSVCILAAFGPVRNGGEEASTAQAVPWVGLQDRTTLLIPQIS